jgi:NTE family protein
VAQKKTAVILAGGVAKGPFEAGALEVLSAQGIHIASVVAASSGALNGIAYAAAIRAGSERATSARLSTLWLEDGNLRHAIDLSLRDIVHLQGISTPDKLVALMRQEVDAITAQPGRHPVAFTLIVTTLNGDTRVIDGQPTTTFEKRRTFHQHDFGTPEGREGMYNFAAASLAFPGLYAPVTVPGVGPCIDGGATNNSPIGAAIEQGAERVILIAPSPALVPPSGAASGIGLISQLAEILVGERLFRDLQQAQQINDALRQLDQLVSEGAFTHEQAAQVREMFKWQTHLEVISIRPPQPLEGSAFTGFYRKSYRADYIAAGREAAVATIEKHALK